MLLVIPSNDVVGGSAREATVDSVTQRSLGDILYEASGFSGSSTGEANSPSGKAAFLAAEAEWRAAIAALTQMVKTLPRLTTECEDDNAADGIALSGPLPVLNENEFGHRLETWVVTPQPLADALNVGRTLLPSADYVPTPPSNKPTRIVPLTLKNPLLSERFCLVVTPAFSVGIVLGQPAGNGPCLQYSFDPHVLTVLWQQIRAYIPAAASDSADVLDKQITQVISAPDYRLITQFTQALLANLPHRRSADSLPLEERDTVQFASWQGVNAKANNRRFSFNGSPQRLSLEDEPIIHGAEDAELLQAMAHEVRTPLTTIRTLTRSLLRRKDLSDDVQKRLLRIDQECTQQIDRFNLIFRAVELETQERDRAQSCLTSIALAQIFQEAIPRWQQQAKRRNLSLDVSIPPDLPRVNSDPTLLNEVLSGAVEWFTQCLPPNSHIHMNVMLAGHQLKLQFEANPNTATCSQANKPGFKRQVMKSVGQLLMVAPETGGLSLNLDVTKNLFEFLGGKLIVRQRPEQGETLTAFLPLDTREV